MKLKSGSTVLSGIYAIECVITGVRYIGSSYNIKTRYKKHIRELNLCKHHCYLLQQAFNKYGESAFRLLILHKCPKESLLRFEQAFIDSHGAANIYNNSDTARTRYQRKQFYRRKKSFAV